MRLDIWGVRGSIPAPGPDTNRYGGNTPCISVVDSSGHLCIVDMGTGIVGLGTVLMSDDFPVNGDFSKGKGKATVLLSHAHWDHIQGFPFFAPVFVPGNHFSIFGMGESAERVEACLEGQMNPHFSPIYTVKNLGAHIEFEGLGSGDELRVSELRISTLTMPHGETQALAFRIEEGEKSLVYASDVGYTSEADREAACEFFRDADLLIHDATYTPAEKEGRKDRGLSSYLEAVDQAVRAGVKELLLFHYDQDHSDEQIDSHLKLCRAHAKKQGAVLEITGAAELMSVLL